MRDWLRVEIRISAQPCVASDAQTERRVQAAPARADGPTRDVFKCINQISRILERCTHDRDLVYVSQPIGPCRPTAMIIVNPFPTLIGFKPIRICDASGKSL